MDALASAGPLRWKLVEFRIDPRHDCIRLLERRWYGHSDARQVLVPFADVAQIQVSDVELEGEATGAYVSLLLRNGRSFEPWPVFVPEYSADARTVARSAQAKAELLATELAGLLKLQRDAVVDGNTGKPIGEAQQ